MSSFPDISVVRQVVIDAANRTGLSTFGFHASEAKGDGSVVTEFDHKMQDLILTQLTRTWPEYSFLGEEMEHDEQARVVESRDNGFWVLDPIDGTTNFSMGFPFYGVSLALVIDGQVRLGVVFDPVRGECFSAVQGKGAELNGIALSTPKHPFALRDCVANVDYKRLVSGLADRLVRYPPYRSQRNLGSSVLEWCWLAAGRLQLYLHGGQRMWDYAAGSLILREAGGSFSTIQGNSLDCQKFTKRSALAAVTPELHQLWLRWVREN